VPGDLSGQNMQGRGPDHFLVLGGNPVGHVSPVTMVVRWTLIPWKALVPLANLVGLVPVTLVGQYRWYKYPG